MNVLEEWRPIRGYELSYEAGSMGRIRSLDRVVSDFSKRRGRVLKQIKMDNGYLKVCLWKAGKDQFLYVHRLIADVFLPNPHSKSEVNHLDGNRANNNISNLEWITHSENVLHSWYVLGRPSGKPFRPVVGISVGDGSRIEFQSLGNAKRAGFSAECIRRCLTGVRRTHRGFKWAEEVGT